MIDATVAILTPPEPGAIAVLQIVASDAASLEHAAGRVQIPVPAVGLLRVGSIAGVDLGVITRWTDTTLHLMPHAGPAVVGEIVRRLGAVGIALIRAEDVDPRELYPEAEDLIETRMLWALSRAASPLAIDLLLDQPRRWRLATSSPTVREGLECKPTARAPQALPHGRAACCGVSDPAFDPTSDPPRDAILNRLITPPTVAAFGPPNVGKSTLCNALAGRSVAIVADEAGTTRDHVGVMIDMAGLVVRYVDTPGMTTLGPRSGATSEEADAVAITRRVLDWADLILCCGDAANPPLATTPSAHSNVLTLTVALRADLGPAGFSHDAAVAARTGEGIPHLATLIRESLVPAQVIASAAPWKFWH